MNNTTFAVIAIVAALALLGAVVVMVTVVGFTVQPAYAIPPPPCPACGASELAPGEDPTGPVWDPNGASADAPGQLAKIPPVPCEACAKDFSPGQKGLKEGIIGSDKKIILD